MASAWEQLTDYAGVLAERGVSASPNPNMMGTQTQSPQIDSLDADFEDVEFQTDSVTVMSPDSVSVSDANGVMNLRNMPERLQQVMENFQGEDRNVSVEMPTTPETEALMAFANENPELQESIDRLAETTDTKFDALTETVDRQSQKQVDFLDKNNTMLARIEDIDRQALDYTKERDFDLDQKAASTEGEPIEVFEKSEDIRAPKPDEGIGLGGGLLAGLLGGKGGRILGILGKVVTRFAGLAGILLLANDLVKAFFGKDLITLVTDGFNYLKDNWKQLASDAFDFLGDMFTRLPGILADAVIAVGEFLKETITSVIDMLFPGFRDTVSEVGDTIKDTLNSVGSFFGITDAGDNVSEVVDTGTDAALGTATVAATAYGATKYLQGRNATANMAEDVATSNEPSKAKPDATKPKQSLFRRGLRGGGKLGLITAGLGTVASSVTGFFGSNDPVPEAKPEVKSVTPTTQKVPELPDKTPAAKAPALPANNVPGAATRASGGMLKKTLGRIPGLTVVMAGMDAASIASDDTMSEEEKTTQYAGVGGSLAGGAAGAVAGAALGSVVPVVGTAIGGILGGIAGSWLGEEAVEGLVSSFLGSGETDSAQQLGTGTDPQEVARQSAEDATESSVVQTRGRRGQVTGVAQDDFEAYIQRVQDLEFDRLEQELKEADRANRSVNRIEGYNQVEAEIQKQYDKSKGTVPIEKIEAQVRESYGLDPVPSKPEINIDTATPIVPYRDVAQPTAPDVIVARQSSDIVPEIVASEPVVSTAMDNTQIRDENLASPEPPTVIAQVNMPEPVKEKPKQNKVVAKTVRPEAPKQVKGGSFNNRPTLDNVPVIVDDAAFTLLNLGYI